MQTEALILVVVKALLELAGFFLFGQGVLYAIAGPAREQNRLYRLFRVLASPIMKFTRVVTPAYVGDRHIPCVAFLLLLWAWLLVVFWLLPLWCGSGAIDCGSLIERKPQA